LSSACTYLSQSYVNEGETKLEYKLRIKRQVRGIEGSLYLCLPKYWTDEAGLQKNEAVTIEFVSNKELLIKVGDRP